MAEVIYWYAKVGVMSEIVIVEKMGPIKWHFHALGKIYDWQTATNKSIAHRKIESVGSTAAEATNEGNSTVKMLWPIQKWATKIFVAQKGYAAGFGPRKTKPQPNTCIGGKINRRPMVMGHEIRNRSTISLRAAKIIVAPFRIGPRKIKTAAQ